MVLPLTSVVARRQDHVVVHTPERPDFVYGSYVSMLRAPRAQQIPELVDLWRREFAPYPEVDTVAIQWESRQGVAKDRWESGVSELPRSFELTSDTVMHARARTIRRSSAAMDLVIHPADGGAEWSEVESLYVSNLSDGSIDSADFLRWRLKSYRSLIDAGSGEWWGAWSQGTLCGIAGLFWSDSLGSFQDVVTDAPYRERGVASGLCGEMAAAFFERFPAGDLVVIAEIDSVAERVYRRLGFRSTGLQWNLEGPRSDL